MVNQVDITEAIRSEEKEGRVVLQTITGLVTVPVEDLIRQPVNGILYDLNRDKVTAISWLSQGIEENRHWVNNYAVALVIEKLYSELAILKEATGWLPGDTPEEVGYYTVCFGRMYNKTYKQTIKQCFYNGDGWSIPKHPSTYSMNITHYMKPLPPEV